MRCSLLKVVFGFALLGLAGSALAADTNGPASFDEAIRAFPKEATNYLARGTAYAQIQDWDKAIDDLIEAARLKPADAAAHEWLGAIYIAKSDLDLAISHLSRAIQLNGTNASTYLN